MWRKQLHNNINTPFTLTQATCTSALVNSSKCCCHNCCLGTSALDLQYDLWPPRGTAVKNPKKAQWDTNTCKMADRMLQVQVVHILVHIIYSSKFCFVSWNLFGSISNGSLLSAGGFFFNTYQCGPATALELDTPDVRWTTAATTAKNIPGLQKRPDRSCIATLHPAKYKNKKQNLFHGLNFDQASKLLIGCRGFLLLLGSLFSPFFFFFTRVLAISEAQQETCNESWMVDFSPSTLICDADEPRAPLLSPLHFPAPLFPTSCLRPSFSPSPPANPQNLRMGSLEEK